MAEQENLPDAGHPLGWPMRVLVFPTLAHCDVIATGPKDERRVFGTLGCLMYAAWGWQCGLFANAARVMLSSDGSWNPTHIALGVLMATIILLTDAIVFMAASWSAQGIAEVERTHEFKLPTSGANQAKSAALIGGRFAMAILIASFMAMVVSLLAFEKDIGRILEGKYQTANAALLREKAASEDAELQKWKNARTELAARIPALEAEERSLRTSNLEPKVDDAQLRLATQAIPAAQAARVAADRELKSARAALAREAYLDGYGRRAAQARVASAERELASAQRSLDEAERRVREQTDMRAVEARRKEGLAATSLAQVVAGKAEIERRIVEGNAAYATRLANREAITRAMVEKDPRHVPRDDGLLVRLQALKELAKDEAIAHALLGFEALLILLELAAVMGKTLTLIPLSYATRMAERDLIRALETGRRLKDVFSAKPKPAPAPDIVVEPTPPVTEPPEPPKPLNGVDRTRRHAPRWKPSFGGGDGEPPREH